MLTKGGYWGRVLRVDLSGGEVSQERLFDRELKMVIGGSGYGAKVLLQEVPASVKPLDPENRLVFAPGPLQATRVSGAAKCSIVSRSPLTGIFGETSVGSSWGLELKRAGFDALIVQGRASRPVFISIRDLVVDVVPAGALWGLDAFDASDGIKRALGESWASVACIGTAGERQVAIASISVDKLSVGGRCGLGAVMGSKNLKGIAVEGTGEAPVADPVRLASTARSFDEVLIENSKDYLSRKGTPLAVRPAEALGELPIRYWRGETWNEGAAKIGAPQYDQVLKPRPRSCPHCALKCRREVQVSRPAKYSVSPGPGPEYSTLAMLGSNCMLSDLKAIAKANDLCNRSGIDTISAGAFAGFIMECFESGFITRAETGGMKLSWGDADGVLEFISQIGLRQGYFGELLAQGIVPAAAKIGKGAGSVAMHVKGLDLPAHDPRAIYSLAISYATASRGASQSGGNLPGSSLGTLSATNGSNNGAKPRDMRHTEITVAKQQDRAASMNSLCLCKGVLLGGVDIEEMLDLLNAVTGWGWNLQELVKAGQRITNMQRMVDVKYGVGSADDRIPERLFQPASKGGRSNAAPTETSFAQALARYYRARGWDSAGAPRPSTISGLDITW